MPIQKQNIIPETQPELIQTQMLNNLLVQLRQLLEKNESALDDAGVREEIDIVLDWAKRAEKGDFDAEDMLEHEGFARLKSIQSRLQLTAQEYMTLEDESPAENPHASADPQDMFNARNDLVNTITTILKLKTQDNWQDATADNIALHVDIVHEAVGVFDNEESLQAAIDELEERGFMRQELSILADDKTVEDKLDHVYKRVTHAQDDPAAPRTIFIPDETRGDAQGALIATPLYIAATTASAVIVASGGTILSALLAASAAGAVGTAIGAVLANFVAKHHADYILSQIERGGLLLWVNLRSPEQADLAIDILNKHSAHNVHTHNIPLYG
tara:strand:- start:154835 stop:155824 length:990 start_codon:yes stop_codon:yes gene_type:complete